MPYTFQFTGNALPVIQLFIYWKRLPFMVLSTFYACQVFCTLYINLILNKPTSSFDLLTIQYPTFTSIITLGVLQLAIAFLLGKIYKQAAGIPQKRGWKIVVIHLIVLTLVYLVAWLLFHSCRVVNIFIIAFTLYVGFSRLLTAKNLLFKIQLLDDTSIQHY